jgi:hypothetical protein
MIRIAWFDRKTLTYDFATAHPISSLARKQKWVQEQNKKIPHTKYWIEFITKDISNNKIIINLESQNLIKIEKYIPDNKTVTDEDNDYLLI